MPQTSKQSKTRTIRLNKDNDDVIQSEADRYGMTVNALINRIILQYVETLRFYEYGNMISMSTDTFMTCFTALSKEEIEDIAYGLGNQKLRESLLRRGLEINYENVIHYIKQLLGEYNGWFRCDYVQDEGADSLHLRHPFDSKWSYFIANYVSGILREVLGLKINLVILEYAVNFKIYT
jgi:hypothetical protein